MNDRVINIEQPIDATHYSSQDLYAFNGDLNFSQSVDDCISVQWIPTTASARLSKRDIVKCYPITDELKKYYPSCNLIAESLECVPVYFKVNDEGCSIWSMEDQKWGKPNSGFINIELLSEIPNES